jgi:hypothetical protein
MARKTKHEQNKEKAAKQKKIAIGGGVVLLALMAIQVPRTMKMMKGHPAPPVVASTSTDGTTTTTVAPADPNSLAAPTLAGSPTAAATTTTDSSSLVASVPLKVDPGQLEQFQRFVSKDPFAAQVNSDGTPVASASSGSKSSGGTAPTGGKKTSTISIPSVTTPSTTTTTPSPAPAPAPSAPPAPAAAVISLNGTLMSVSPNTDFPTASPVFHLISVTASTAKIGIAGGSYANGSAALTLKLKTPVTLQNTADGTKYTLILEPPTTVVTSGTTTTPAATTTPGSAPVVPSGSGG